jgi:hypothetical protein
MNISSFTKGHLAVCMEDQNLSKSHAQKTQPQLAIELYGRIEFACYKNIYISKPISQIHDSNKKIEIT